MKSFKQHIFEKLKVSSNNRYIKPTLFPRNRFELKQMIKDEISKNGNECSLNHIDISKITNMTGLFFRSNFNGDISAWDVSNVENMSYMFGGSRFKGDISDWDVSSVKYMGYMFYGSKFNGDISEWDVSNVKDMTFMFHDSPLKNNPPKWYKK